MTLEIREMHDELMHMRDLHGKLVARRVLPPPPVLPCIPDQRSVPTFYYSYYYCIIMFYCTFYYIVFPCYLLFIIQNIRWSYLLLDDLIFIIFYVLINLVFLIFFPNLK